MGIRSFLEDLISTVTSLSLATDKNLESNETSSFGVKSSELIPSQVFGREPPVLYKTRDQSDKAANNKKEIEPPTRTPKQKHTKRQPGFTKALELEELEPTKKLQEFKNRNEIKRNKKINKHSILRANKNAKTSSTTVNIDQDYKPYQFNPYINNFFQMFHEDPQNTTDIETQRANYIKKRLWPEEANITVFEKGIKLPTILKKIETLKNINKKEHTIEQTGVTDTSEESSGVQKAAKSTEYISQDSQSSSEYKDVSSNNNTNNISELHVKKVFRNSNRKENQDISRGYMDSTDMSLYLTKANLGLIPKSWSRVAKTKTHSSRGDKKKHHPKHILRYEDDEPFIRNIKPEESKEIDNNGTVRDVLHEIWEEGLQEEILNKAKQEYFHKIKEEKDSEKKLHELNLPPTDIVDIINGTTSLWQPWVHRVKDDSKMNYFINRTLKKNLQLFRTIELRITDVHWKSVIKSLEKTYEKKFKEFVKETKYHKVKSRMGTERVVLNCLEESNRMVKRLFNYALHGLEKKGYFHNSRALRIIDKELKLKTQLEIRNACLKLSVCRVSNGFIEFVIDFLSTLLSLNDNKFEKAYDSLIAAVKHINLSHTLGKKSDKYIKTHIYTYAYVNLMYKQATIKIIKNIFAQRNSPLIVYGDSSVDQVNKTIALLEIINILDKDVPQNSENLEIWDNLKTRLMHHEKAQDGTRKKDQDWTIQTVMTDFVHHFKNVIDNLNVQSWVKIIYNAKIVLN